MVRCFLVLVLVVVALPLLAIDLPQAPVGFRWEEAKEIKGAFLLPKAWHFRHERNKETLAYFATREDLANNARFTVGLTVNVMPRLKGRDAAAYAEQFILGFSRDKKVLKTWDASMGPFRGAGCLVDDGVAVMHTLMVANPKTNTLYYFMFEAPRDEWDQAWKIGEQMVKLLYLDDEI
jgi:hypothetical protein